MISQYYSNFDDVIQIAGKEIKDKGKLYYPENWQATKLDRGMVEIFNYNFSCKINPKEYTEQIKPDKDWADEHFDERISGIPLNPPPSFERWPYYKDDEKWRKEEKFSHTYPERFWPPKKKTTGIRFNYGNLQDVIQLLLKDPQTRQAFLPVWFPEDTGVVHGERVPCTIGYWFIRRGDKFSIFYVIRSCDYRRHFRNDIYLACKLLLYVLDELRRYDFTWEAVKPHTLTMNIWNLHVFEGEEYFL